MYDLEDIALAISLIIGFMIFLYIMFKINDKVSLTNLGLPACIIVFSFSMTIAISPLLIYENIKNKHISINEVKENIVALYNLIFLF